MARHTISSCRHALDHFLSKIREQPDRQKALYVYPDYGCLGSARAVESFHRDLDRLEGVVEATWKGPKGARYVDRIKLVCGRRLCAHLGVPYPGDLRLTEMEQAVIEVLPNGEDVAAWARLAKVIDGRWPVEAVGALVSELIDIRGRCTGDRFLVAAAGPLSSSKILDAIPVSCLEGIGVSVQDLGRPPVPFLVAGPPEPQAVVLVENPRSFYTACKVAGDRVAWISSHGLAVNSLASEESLSDLASNGIGAVVQGSPPPLAQLLRHENLLYWGDLDLFGLRIFEMARKRLPHLRLSALYRPMINLLERGGGHPYAELAGKAGQVGVWPENASDLRHLTALCAERAVDQEHVTSSDIRQLAALPLHPSELGHGSETWTGGIHPTGGQ